MTETEEEDLLVTVFRNGWREGGKCIKVNSTLEEFLQCIGKALNLETTPQFIFTEDGGEIEELGEIFHMDNLYISCGEPFVYVQKEVPTIATSTTSHQDEKKPTVDRKAEYRKHEAAILQIQSVFPDYNVSELLTAFLLNRCSIDRTIDYLVTQPNVPLDSLTPNSEKQTPRADEGEVKLMVCCEYDDGGKGRIITIKKSEWKLMQSDMNRFLERANSFLKLPDTPNTIYTKYGGEVENLADLELEDDGPTLLYLSFDDEKETLRRIAESEKTMNSSASFGRYANQVKELQEILPHLSRVTIEQALDNANGDMNQAMLFLL